MQNPSLCVHACWVASVVSDSGQLYGSYPTRLLCPWDSPGKNPGVDCHAPLQGLSESGILLHISTLLESFPIWVTTDYWVEFTVMCSQAVSSVAQSCPTLRPHELQHTRPPCPSPTPGVHPNPRPLSQWCHPAISSSVVPFSSCPESLPASGSFPVSQIFTWGGQSTGVSASASVLPVNTQDWSPLEWTGWISLQSKGLSRVFSNTTVQKHQFSGAQHSSQSSSHIHTWPLEKP